MLTRDQILRIVGKTWWENDNVLMDFIHNHLSREGAKIFTKEHCAFAAHFPQWFGNVITPVPTSPDFSPHQILGGLYY